MLRTSYPQSLARPPRRPRRQMVRCSHSDPPRPHADNMTDNAYTPVTPLSTPPTFDGPSSLYAPIPMNISANVLGLSTYQSNTSMGQGLGAFVPSRQHAPLTPPNSYLPFERDCSPPRPLSPYQPSQTRSSPNSKGLRRLDTKRPRRYEPQPPADLYLCMPY